MVLDFIEILFRRISFFHSIFIVPKPVKNGRLGIIRSKGMARWQKSSSV